MPLVEINYLNALIVNKRYFDLPLKNKQEGYEKLVEISRNEDYITRNLLDFSYHQKFFELFF